MKKNIIILISILGIAITGVCAAYYIKNRIRLSEIKEKLSETIGKDQGLTEIILKIPQSDITYGEVFDLCSKSVDERNKLIVELRGLYPNMENVIKDSLIDFLSIENDLVRDQSQCSRRYMEYSSEKKRFNTLRQSEYSDYYSSTFSEIRKEMEENLQKYMESRKSFEENYRSLLIKEASLNKIMKNNDMRFMLMFVKYKELNNITP